MYTLGMGATVIISILVGCLVAVLLVLLFGEDY
jgi:hypothetical protein